LVKNLNHVHGGKLGFGFRERSYKLLIIRIWNSFEDEEKLMIGVKK
jgi:hypothetical protein